MPDYQGPVRPGQSESKFRETGKTETEKKEDLYVNIDDINKPDANVMTREEAGLDKPPVIKDGSVVSAKTQTPQTKQVTDVTKEQVAKTVTEQRNVRQEQYLEKLRQQTEQNLQQRRTLQEFKATADYQKYKSELKDKSVSDVDVYNKYVEETNRQQLAEREKLGQGYSTKEGYIYVKPTEKVETKPLETVTPPEPKKTYKLSDVDIKGEFITGQRDYNKVGVATYVEQKASSFFNKVGGVVLQVVPEGKVKEALSKKYAFSYTELAKTSLFTPSSTTSQIASQKLTKLDTTFIGGAVQREGGQIISEQVALTKETGGLFTKRYVSNIRTISKVNPVDESTQMVTSISGGVTRKVKPSIVGKPTLTKPEQFLSKDVAMVKQGEEGFSGIFSVGQTQPYKKDVTYYTTLGVSRKVDDLNYYAGRGRVLQKTEAGFEPTVKIGIRGVVKDIEEQPSTFIFKTGNQIQKTDFPKAAIEQQQKAAIESAIVKPVKETSIIKPSVRVSGKVTALEEVSDIKVTTVQPQVQQPITRNKLTTISATDQQTSQGIKTKLRVDNILREKTQTIPKAVPTTITTTTTKQNQRLNLAQVNLLRVNELLKTKTTQKPIIPQRTVTNNIRIVPPRISRESKINVESNLFPKLIKAYSVIIKRRGKEVEIGKALPLGKAKKLGITSVLGSLARSYRLKEVGTTQIEDINYEEPIGVFRPSKGGGFRVQRSRFALSSVGEKREILSARRKAGGKINWL